MYLVCPSSSTGAPSKGVMHFFAHHYHDSLLLKKNILKEIQSTHFHCITIEYDHALPQTSSLQGTRTPVARVMKLKIFNDRIVVQNF